MNLTTNEVSEIVKKTTDDSYLIREANTADKKFVVYAMHELLKELRNVKQVETIANAELTYDRILKNKELGQIFVAYINRGDPIGYLSVSFHPALHCGGDVTIFEELWVDPQYRNSWVGMMLIKKAEKYSRLKGIMRIEVGLANYSFPDYKNLYDFYLRMGYVDIGPRMKKILNC